MKRIRHMVAHRWPVVLLVALMLAGAVPLQGAEVAPGPNEPGAPALVPEALLPAPVALPSATEQLSLEEGAPGTTETSRASSFWQGLGVASKHAGNCTSYSTSSRQCSLLQVYRC